LTSIPLSNRVCYVLINRPKHFTNNSLVILQYCPVQYYIQSEGNKSSKDEPIHYPKAHLLDRFYISVRMCAVDYLFVFPPRKNLGCGLFS
ncbi:unnamed protein product, partial [Callosobruchus maculatus]